MTTRDAFNSKMTDGQLGRMERRIDQIRERVDRGALDFDWMMEQLRMIDEKQNTMDKHFPAWGTIHLGTGLKTVDDFRDALRCAMKHMSGDARESLNYIASTIKYDETRVDLVIVSNAKLGFKKGTEMKNTYARALELGLERCPIEVGPQILLQCTDDKRDNIEYFVAMEHITKMGNQSLLLYSGEQVDSGEWGFFGRKVFPETFCPRDSQFMFCRIMYKPSKLFKE